MASSKLGSPASARNTSMRSGLSMPLQQIILGRECPFHIHLPCTFPASRLYVTGCKVNMELRAPNITNRDMKASGFYITGEFRIYNKISQASRGFPRKVGLSVTRSVGLAVKQVGGPLGKEEYAPEYQYVPEEDDGPLSEAALRPLPPKSQPVAMDDNLPQGDSDFAIQEFDSDYDSYDFFNSSIEDFDPAQDDTDYNPLSDETLEPPNAFGLGESSVLRTTLLSGQQQRNENESKTSNASPSNRANILKLTPVQQPKVQYNTLTKWILPNHVPTLARVRSPLFKKQSSRLGYSSTL